MGSDSETEVRKHVCQALVLLLELCLDRLQPYMEDIVKVGAGLRSSRAVHPGLHVVTP